MAFGSIGIDAPFRLAVSDDSRRDTGPNLSATASHSVDLCRGTGDHGRMRYVVTGGTGFIGRRVVSRILDRARRRRGVGPGPSGVVDAGSSAWPPRRHPWGDRAKPLVGDLTAADLGLSDETIAELGAVDHVVHCAAIYDITVAEDDQRAANVDGTRAVIALARRLDATLHHVSSIAVAGTYRGEYTEDDFDVAQDLPTPYHQTKFEAELLVRSDAGLRYRIYRPAVVVGDSRTGEMDKVDGPVLLLPRPGEAGAAAVVHPDAAARHRTHQHRSGRLRRRRHRRVDPCARPRRPDVPSHRPRQPSACAGSIAASPRRRGCRGCAVRCHGAPRHRSCGRPVAPRCCATWR